MDQDSRHPIDPRIISFPDQTQMASFRTQLALDRTTLSWIRTALSMGSFGFGMVAFFRPLHKASSSDESILLYLGAIRMGVALILLGIVATIFASLSHWFTLRRLRRGETPVLSHWPWSLTVALLSAVIGLAGLWELFMK
ncbi:MAG: DUF202 domain-containing protein [Planctomycetales bacterium]|jgi:putative membrane protein|nr:DUF202 domain-containing protein [Planctomycetales bacterium]